MMRTRSQSLGRGDSNPDSDPPTGIPRSGSNYSIGGHGPISPASPSRHSVSRREYGSSLEDESVQRYGHRLLFFENLIFSISKTFDIFGKRMQVILGGLLELIVNCLVDFVLEVRKICRWTSDQYDRREARIDVESFLWVGFWSLVVILFFIPPNSEANVVKRVARFVVGTFQTTGLLYVLFFMLYLYR